MLSGRGLCDELITRPDESYRLRCVVVCDPETSRMRRPWSVLDRSATKKNKNLNLNSKHQLVVYADDVNIVGESVHTTRENT